MASSGLKFLHLELAFQRGVVTGLKDLCTEKFGGKCRVTADKRILSPLDAHHQFMILRTFGKTQFED